MFFASHGDRGVWFVGNQLDVPVGFLRTALLDSFVNPKDLNGTRGRAKKGPEPLKRAPGAS